VIVHVLVEMTAASVMMQFRPPTFDETLPLGKASDTGEMPVGITGIIVTVSVAVATNVAVTLRFCVIGTEHVRAVPEHTPPLQPPKL
jgi:hypothetical protein